MPFCSCVVISDEHLLSQLMQQFADSILIPSKFQCVTTVISLLNGCIAFVGKMRRQIHKADVRSKMILVLRDYF